MRILYTNFGIMARSYFEKVNSGIVNRPYRASHKTCHCERIETIQLIYNSIDLSAGLLILNFFHARITSFSSLNGSANSVLSLSCTSAVQKFARRQSFSAPRNDKFTCAAGAPLTNLSLKLPVRPYPITG